MESELAETAAMQQTLETHQQTIRQLVHTHSLINIEIIQNSSAHVLERYHVTKSR